MCLRVRGPINRTAAFELAWRMAMSMVVDTVLRPIARNPSVSLASSERACFHVKRTFVSSATPVESFGHQSIGQPGFSFVSRRDLSLTACVPCAAIEEGPSCMFLGPVESEDKQRLEAFYAEVCLLIPSRILLNELAGLQMLLTRVMYSYVMREVPHDSVYVSVLRPCRLRQARDSYYSGRPLVVDDIFDRVEVTSLTKLFQVHAASLCTPGE